MRIEDLMVRNPICINEGASITEAIELMKENSIRHLPVLDADGFLAGFVTLSDLKQGIIPSMMAGLTLKDLMIKKPVTANPEDEVETAARVICEKKIGGMPVVNKEGRILGIITVIDILRAFAEMMGLLTASVRVDVSMGSDEDAFQKVSNIIKQSGGQILSVALAAAKGKNVYGFRLTNADVKTVTLALEEGGYKVLGSSS